MKGYRLMLANNRDLRQRAQAQAQVAIAREKRLKRIELFLSISFFVFAAVLMIGLAVWGY